MKWFKHDSDANADAKLRKLRLKYGMEGYGIYWYCLELIAQNVEKNNLTFELEHDAEILAHDTGIHIDRIQEIMQDMVKIGLFENDVGAITCIKMALRLDETTSKHPRIKMLQESIRKNSRQSPDSLPTVSGKSPARIDEMRIDENRTEKKSRFTPPSLDEVIEYCKERNNGVDPQKFIDHYTANGWVRGKSKVKDWRACVRTWENSAFQNARPTKIDQFKGAI